MPSYSDSILSTSSRFGPFAGLPWSNLRRPAVMSRMNLMRISLP